jgi:phosphoribosyl-ATP pyrophosphohydrolase/phosphoribosyl-AMP cyclohydrolase
MLDLDQLNFDRGNGLVTVVAQDAVTGVVLMVAHADREALERTLATGDMHYRSRSRGLWRKGDTSGNTQRVESLLPDCDGDAVLARVHPAGPACHTGAVTCFGDAARAADDAASDVPPSYTRRLLADRNLRLKKIGEESAELVAACADGDTDRAAEEAADLVYHTLVALRAAGGSLDHVRRVLARRRA